MNPTRRIATLAGLKGVLALGFLLAGCADEDTIVAVNIMATDDVGAIDSIGVTITQRGRAPFSTTIDPPLETAMDGGMSVLNRFFERVTLPGDWSRVAATVSAEAVDSNGVSFSDETSVTLRPGGAVAAFLEFALPPPVEPPPEPPPEDMNDAGMGDAGTGMDDAGS